MEQACPMDLHLLGGCFVEADRCAAVADQLEQLGRAVGGEPGAAHLAAVVGEVRAGCRLLRELADLSQVHQDRVPLVLDPLNVALPCLARSLRDMTEHYVDRSRSRADRWRNMYHSMTAEAGGLSLPGQFMLLNHYLCSTRDLLVRSPNFDLNMLETLRQKVMFLREARHIPPPSIHIGPPVGYDALAGRDADPTTHWAEHIFSRPLPSRTELGRQEDRQHRSKSLGPHFACGQLGIPVHSKILFRRPFNDDQISLTAFRNGIDRAPYLLLRIFVQGAPWFAVRGVHELCIDRDGSCLQLKRWSRSEGRSKVWAVLCFVTWEELVLMHAAFVSLKARNGLTVSLHPEEFSLRDESKLFQARIQDDGFEHFLIVYRDRASGALRLHAAVRDGELRHCPVWTAFVTHQAASPTWLRRVSRRRVLLADVQPYVFCHQYRPLSQRRGPVGAFELHFVTEEAAGRFVDVFYAPPAAPEAP